MLPIINENDTVATAEIQFGDNDILGALVARGMQARQYIMLSTANGFQKHGRHVSMVDYGNIRPLYQYVSGEHSENGTGGMRSKLDAARLVTRHGMTATIASGNEPHVLARLLEGHRGGLGEAYGHVMSTRFLPRP
ncbi:glutamate 5-kinase, partial [Candidatus Woesearchaeota archaeon CG11_big_fil_rev_8_21_14_0_20_57_5]